MGFGQAYADAQAFLREHPAPSVAVTAGYAGGAPRIVVATMLALEAAGVLGAFATAAWLGTGAGAAAVVGGALGFGIGGIATTLAHRAIRVAALYQAVAEVDGEP